MPLNKTILHDSTSNTSTPQGYKGVQMVLGMAWGAWWPRSTHGKNIIMKQGMKKRYVGIKEVSEYTSLPVKTLYEWSAQGRIPSIKIGRRVLFDLHDIDKVMARLKRTNNQCDKIANKIVVGVHGNGI